MKKFFIAGLMQGSIVEEAIHSQDYRAEIKSALAEAFPDADVYDPFERNKDSLFYSPEEGKKTFLGHNRMCGTEIDVLVAFVPEASMGTAIEIWEAWRNGALILTISPMSTNWAIKFLSDVIYPDLDAFRAALAAGEIARLVAERPRTAPRSF